MEGFTVFFITYNFRLAPMKAISIPRLELSAALAAVKVDESARRELDCSIGSFYISD